jgi:lysophospholipase L1-like esterase
MTTERSGWALFGSVMTRFLLALVAVGCVGEFVARVFITTPSNQQFDAQLGWVYEPDSMIFSSREGGTALQLNSIGFNDESIRPAEDRRRILFLGDSITESLQVRQRANFTSVLERLDPTIEAINLGRSAMSPAHYGVVLDRYTAHLVPEWTIVVLTRGDLLDLLRDNIVITRDANQAIEAMSLRPAATDRFKATLGPILRRSALVTHLARRLKPAVTDTIRDWVCWVRGCEQEPLGSAFDQAYAQNHQAEAAQRLHFALVALQKKRPLIAIYVPALQYGVRGEVTQAYPWEGRVYASVARTLEIPYLDTTEALTKAYRATGQPPHGFANAIIGSGHLNESGHEAVGRALHGWLQSLESSTDRSGGNR